MVNNGDTNDGGGAELTSPPRLVNIHTSQPLLGDGDRAGDLTTALTKALARSAGDDATLPLSPASGNASDALFSTASGRAAPHADADAGAAGSYGDGGGTTLEVTVTVLSLHGLVAKRDKPARKGRGKRKGRRDANPDGVPREERATVVASFSQHLSRKRVFLTHVPSRPLPLAGGGGAAASSASVSSTLTASTNSNNTGGGGTQGNGGGETPLQPVVHWPSAGDGDGDDEGGAAGTALSTLQFQRHFVREESSSETNHNPNGHSGNSGSSVRHRFVPQTCPITLSVSRNGKMALLGRVGLVINGEERGEGSITVPVATSLRRTAPALNKGVRKLRRARGGGGGEGAPKDTPMVRIKGDAFRFGLREDDAMLRVLVRVRDPAASASQGSSSDDDDDDAAADDDSYSDGDDGCLSLEGETSSILDQDDYTNHYLRESAELRTLRHENDVLHMELAHAQQTHEAQRAHGDQDQRLIEDLQREMQGQALVDAGKITQMDELAGTLEQANMNAEVLLEAQALVREENERLREENERLREERDALARRGGGAVPHDIRYLGDAGGRERCLEENERLAARLDEATAAIAALQNHQLQGRTEATHLSLEANQATARWRAAQAEADALPCYEKRVGELLAELRERDAEVASLKEELEEVRGGALRVDELLWEDDTDEDDVYQVDDAAHDEAGGAEEGKVAGGPKKEGDEGWGVRRFGASLLSMEASMKERQRRFREQQQRAEQEGQVRKEGSVGAVAVGEDGAAEGAVQEAAGTRTSQADNGGDAQEGTEMPRAMLSSISEDKLFMLPGNGCGVEAGAATEIPAAEATAEEEEEDDNDPAKEQEGDGLGGGWGVRNLGSRLLSVEERMKQRQLLFREQRLQAERQRDEELRAGAAAAALPGVGDVLMSSRKGEETVTESPLSVSTEGRGVEKSDEEELKEIEGELSTSHSKDADANDSTEQLDDVLLLVSVDSPCNNIIAEEKEEEVKMTKMTNKDTSSEIDMKESSFKEENIESAKRDDDEGGLSSPPTADIGTRTSSHVKEVESTLPSLLPASSEKDTVSNDAQHLVEELSTGMISVEEGAVVEDRDDLASNSHEGAGEKDTPDGNADVLSTGNSDNPTEEEGGSNQESGQSDDVNNDDPNLTTNNTERSREKDETQDGIPQNITLIKEKGGRLEKEPQEASIENATKAAGGWGLRNLKIGSKLKHMEGRMKERQRLVREQQLRELKQAERERALQAANAEPGLGGVLISRFSSHGGMSRFSSHGNGSKQVTAAAVPSPREGTHESAAKNDDKERTGSDDDEKEESQERPSPTSGDNDDEMAKVENPSSLSPPSSPLDSLSDVALVTEEATNKRSSMQPLLLQSVDWLEEELLLGIINSNEAPSTAAASTETSSPGDGGITNESATHSGLVSHILSGETVGCDDSKIVLGMSNPTTRLSDASDQSTAELPSSNASKDDVTSAAVVSHSPSISAPDSAAPEVEQEPNPENTEAEQESASERAEEKEEDAREENAETKQQESASEGGEKEDSAGRENPEANQGPASESAEKEEGLVSPSKPESKREPAPESAEKENIVDEEELMKIINGLPLTTPAYKSSSPSGGTNEAEEGKEPSSSPSTHLSEAGPIDKNTPAIIGLPDKPDIVSDSLCPDKYTATSCNNSDGFYECDES